MNAVATRIATILDHIVLEDLTDKELTELQRELWFWHSRCQALNVKREAPAK